VSFAAITLCVPSQQVLVFVSMYFLMDSVRKLLDTPSYIHSFVCLFIVVVLNEIGVGYQGFFAGAKAAGA
jgi:hypothetical protein